MIDTGGRSRFDARSRPARATLGSHVAARLVAAFTALTLLLGATAASADPASPPDVPAAWHLDGRTLVLPPVPHGYSEAQRGPVRWVHPREEGARVEALEEVFQAHYPRIAAELGQDLDPSMTILLARDLDQMRALAPIGHPPPRYAVGVAYPAAGVVLLSLDGHGLGARPDVETVLVHELSHVALQRAVSGAAVPRWFSEGLAVLQAGEQTLARMQTLLGAYVEGGPPRLATLDRSFSGRPFEVDVAYAASADVVGYLSRVENGARKLRRLIARLRRGERFEEALTQSHYVGLASLDREWRADLRERYGSLPFVVGGSALWAVASVLLVLAWRKRRREKHRKLRRLEQEEIALERLEALVAAKLAEASSSGDAVAEAEDIDDIESEAPQSDGPPAQDLEVPTIVHRGRSHTLH